MKITIIGGSKGTGARLAVLATGAGHEVTALSRSGTAPDGVRAVAGDATDPAVVSGVVTGADAVVVTVGGAKGARRHRAVVTRSVVRAMEQTDVDRLIVQSSLDAGDSGALMPAPLRLLMKGVLAAPLADHNEQEAAVTGSSLAWTIVRPTGLTNRPRVFVHSQNLDPVGAARVVDEHAPSLGQDRRVGGVPRYRQRLGDAGDGQVLPHDGHQRPPQGAGGRAWRAARPRGWCPGATRAHNRCTGSGAP